MSPTEKHKDYDKHHGHSLSELLYVRMYVHTYVHMVTPLKVQYSVKRHKMRHKHSPSPFRRANESYFSIKSHTSIFPLALMT